MKRITVALVSLLVLGASSPVVQGRTSVPAASARARAGCTGAVGWQRARSLSGQYATVRGRVVGALYASSSNGSPTFLDIGARYPNRRRVTALIWIENRWRFGAPEPRYRGRTVCIHGLIEMYRGAAQIELTSPEQIRVVR